MRKLLVASLAVLLGGAPLLACSTFCLVRNGDVVFGRNYDFEIGEGAVLVNRRGIRKTSVKQKTFPTLSWTSRYGSVTFNQFGKEFPMDGMNEAGLVVALMWLDGSQYPADDQRPPLGVLEWIQYQLDNKSSVEHLLRDINELRVRGGTPLHYLVADASGDTATIEYLNGQLVVHRGASLPARALTNSRYDESAQYLKQFRGFGGNKSAPSGAGSLERFVRASLMLRDAAPSDAVTRTFEILESVAQRGSTRWSVAFDAAAREVSWRSDDNSAIRKLRMSELDFSCSSATLFIDVDSGAGDVAKLLDVYTPEENLNRMLQAYATTSFLRNTPRESVEVTARHGSELRCAPPAKRVRPVGRQ